MHSHPPCREMQPKAWTLVASWLAMLAVFSSASAANAHEIWVETTASGQVGQGQEIRVCWGHSGHRESGEKLKGQQSKLTSWFVPPDAPSHNLPLTLKPDCFVATITPAGQGIYMVGAVCQTGILDREFHGMPAKTRLVMLGKTVFHVGQGSQAVENSQPMELDLAPVGDAMKARPGGVFIAKVSFKKAPIGGQAVVATLSTLGNRPFPKDPEVEGMAWSAKNNAARRTGEVRFPLIVAGRHILSVKYMDETPGRYEGDLEFTTRFSHLRKGAEFQRTLYIASLTFDVQGE